jgi:hypothetical protein
MHVRWTGGPAEHEARMDKPHEQVAAMCSGTRHETRTMPWQRASVLTAVTGAANVYGGKLKGVMALLWRALQQADSAVVYI